MDQRLFILIGPGDSGKSTILDSLYLLLGDRWDPHFSDTDFHAINFDNPIMVEAVLIDPPNSLTRVDTFGLWLSGVDDSGTLFQDPEDQFTPALIVRLTVKQNLEPEWTIQRCDGTYTYINASQRRHFSTFKVATNDDAQLRWSRNSALGRLTADHGAQRSMLNASTRLAREALQDSIDQSLASILQQVQANMNAVGGGRFSEVKPGLDTSRSQSGMSLALYDGPIPLTSFGQGSRRLASFAIQQLAAGDRSIVVMDEIENGLEPHRSVQLLTHLARDERYSQVFITTHSNIVIEQAKLESLVVVRRNSESTNLTCVSAKGDTFQRLRRSAPSSLLARHVIVVEGRTEFGLVSGFLDHVDEIRSSKGLTTRAGEGIALQDGGGGATTIDSAQVLRELGYSVAVLMDNDDRSVDAKIESLRRNGVPVIRWDVSHCTESQVCSRLNANGLSSLLAILSTEYFSEETLIHQLVSRGLPASILSLDVGQWLSSTITLEQARTIVSNTAIKHKWFKGIDNGYSLSRWILANQNDFNLETIIHCLEELIAYSFTVSRDHLYGVGG